MPAKKKATDDPEVNDSKRVKPAVGEEEHVIEGGDCKLVDLKSLLSEKPESEEACETWFARIADRILNHCELVANKKVYRVVELEFYYDNKSSHRDTFIHGDKLQLETSACWYFHKSGTTYKSGTYKGLDISFGAPNQAVGGILLRSLEDWASHTVIEGSCKLVDAILSTSLVASIPELVKHKDFSLDVTKPGILYLRDSSLGKHRPLFPSPRVGLTLKRHDLFKEHFIMKPYRFISLAKEVKKQRQTLVLSLYAAGMPMEEIMSVTGAGKVHVKRYVEEFTSLPKNKKISSFKGLELKAEMLSQLYAAYLRDKPPAPGQANRNPAGPAGPDQDADDE